MNRHQQVRWILWVILFLNLLVAFAKLILGYLTQTASVLADGFHSLSDGASNIVGLIGITVASRPEDWNHHYGHRKYETIAAMVISMFLAVVCFELLKEAIGRLQHPIAPTVTPLSFGIMLATLAINFGVTTFEFRRGKELKSELLIADSYHTRSDILTTIGVLIALVSIRLGYPIMDVLATFVIVGFIGYAAFQIFSQSAKILGDTAIPITNDIERVVRSFAEVRDCHKIRTLGHPDEVRVDLHVLVDPHMPTAQVHDLSHQIQDRIKSELPTIVEVLIHIEPVRE